MERLLLLILSFLVSTQLLAQSANPQASRSNNALKYSFGYFGHYKLSPKWGIHVDVQYRMDEKLKFTFQNVYRLGLIRYLKPDLGLVGGYAQFHTQSEAFEDYFTEHRIWEQVYYLKRFNHRSMLYRFRLEQRFVEKLKFSASGEVETDEYNYGNRLRFYHRTTFDLTKDPDAQNVFYVALQDEVFFNVNAPEINFHYFDQNRFLFGVGIFKDKHTKLEMGYVNFFLNPSLGHNIMVHSLNFAVVQTLDFEKQE
jgi:hypothetical protein